MSTRAMVAVVVGALALSLLTPLTLCLLAHTGALHLDRNLRAIA